MKKILTLLLLFPITLSYSQAGMLDNSFNPGPTVYGSTAFYANTAVLQSDGKIIIGGYFNSFNGVTKNKILRLNTDGSIDLSFNIGTGFDSEQYYDVYSIAIQTDGKIIVAGSFSKYNGSNVKGIIRLNSDGTIDNTFNFQADFYRGGLYSRKIYTVVIQDDGKIVLGGDFTSYTLPGSSTQIYCNYILRLNPDGSIDNTFSTGTGFNKSVRKLVKQPDGKIIAGGGFELFNNVWTPTLVRLNSDGTRDTNFQIWDGFSNNTPDDGEVYDIDLLPDSSMYISGYFTHFDNTSCGKIVRLLPNGNRDWSYNLENSLTMNYAYSDFTTVESNGKIVVCNSGNYNGNYIWNVFRLNPDGTFDTTFNSGNGFNDRPRFSILQPDGKLIFFGPFTTYNGTAIKYIARIYGDPPQLITNHSNQNNYLLFPNPCNSILHFQLPNDSIAEKIFIYDLSGKTLYEKSNIGNSLNIENFSEGIYFIKIYSGNDVFQTKFIKN